LHKRRSGDDSDDAEPDPVWRFTQAVIHTPDVLRGARAAMLGVLNIEALV
jgi:hypothetical protein